MMATGTYSNVETQVYSYVINTLGYNTAIACGILANVEAESNFNPEAVGDGGDAYGLFQWNDRRKKLFSHAGTTKPSVSQQLSFVKYELNSTETRARNAIEKLPNTAQGAYDAADIFCRLFERPANSTSEGARRGGIARDKYWSKYANGSNPSVGVNFVPNLGQRIVQIAKSALGLPYVQGGNMYDNERQGADSPGLVYYSYKEAGVDIPESTIAGYHKAYSSTAKRINDVSDVCAADLLFYLEDNVGIGDIAIANGDGGMIYVSKSLGVTEVDDIGSPADILRVLSDAETSQGYVPSSSESSNVIGTNAIDYIALTSHDPYSLSMKNNLSRIKSEGYDYGYLIDLTHGGGFRFYVPDFTEQAGANWSNIELRGRSVSVKSYDSTESRTITVSLDLYAGAGLYAAVPGESGEDTVSRMHKDAYFVKSLEYPDYSNAITRPPSTVHLILGSAVNILGVVSNVIIEHLHPLDSQNRAMYLKMNFTVTQTAINPPDYSDIRRGQYSIIGTSDIDSLNTGSSDQDPTNAPIYSEEDER